MRVVIIGASHAGISAATQLKQLNPKIDVVLIERTHSLAYLASALHLVLADQLEILKQGQRMTLDELIRLNIHVMLDTNVTKIDPKQKTVTLNAIDETAETLSYDRLILAMGSTQPQIPIEFQTGEITTYKSFKAATRALEKFEQVDQIAIIGAGLIGLELADALKNQKEVVLIDRMNDVLFRYFDSELTHIIKEHLRQNVTIYLGETIQKIVKHDKTQEIHLREKQLMTQAIVYAVNPRPTIDLVTDFLEITLDGTIKTDAFLRTSDEHIYAIGDLISLPFKNTQETSYIPLLSNAITTGLVAAQNIVLGNQLICPSVQRTVVSSFFGLHVASTGITQEEAPYYGISSDSYTKTFHLHTHKQPKKAFVTLKLVYKTDTKQLIGGQLLTDSSHYVDWIDLISLAINQETSIDTLAVMDFYFQPLFNEPIHPVSQVALAILAKNRDT